METNPMEEKLMQQDGSAQDQVGQAPKKRGLRFWIAGGTVGLALGALVLGGTAFAQTDVESTGTGLGQTFIERLASNLGIASDELRSAIKQTGVEVVDEAVTNGQLTEEQGEALKERIESGDGFPRFGGPHGPRGGFGMIGRGVGLETIATELGITTEELRTELSSDATLSEIITEHDSTVEEIVDSLVSEVSTKLDEAVSDGRLTEEQADQILSNLPERLTEMINNHLLGPWHHCGFHEQDGGSATDDEEATQTSHV